ncbi:2-succinyl-6-hydroxy-2,4-cyclohexadiene-1-carboxylate synthase [Enterovibrio nigricans]|uniref:Putative 2-succinyl-6-hydroxy-2,4-cyclohexadiene-1-carboxylate synthase n=1 Tax=Enterovibrio nigricans DSM 22720 TaxID=1121868 RepID=A0A1T4USY1_9GAMM|nr:2-succinyl-6-hydroxy-2,4-cyclohexadiene-1-carboxylate synthase [Enterovibrio nigricans]PKF51022.1 2-succinyl-6-hydroxy-2,4-cyclohexadiene-1-carboxylate synthase [Enterovibrio nigricans]SKA55551.1 2-succinyl-6-hydroxy-2,4-cyclohexadiene-1-carboxylate synthase [Enterovibrio nigricans DSM 22720]
MQVCSDMLAATLQKHENASAPTLVFLHGLLGSQKDWQPVVDQLACHYSCLTLDLPGHGASADVDGVDFDTTCRLILQSIAQHVDGPIWLIGYSLGARLAMYISSFHTRLLPNAAFSIDALIVESGHTGIPPQEREARWQNDKQWAIRFEQEPMSDVLQNWYEQPVFSSLNHEQKQCLVAVRGGNLGNKVASMLRATSLSKQPLLCDALRDGGIPVHFICGEGDGKFLTIARGAGFDFHIVPNAGHNIHAEQPKLFSQLVKQLIETI